MSELEIQMCEVIGLKTTISHSVNKQLVGLCGKTIFETHHMLTIETKNGKKQIPKSTCTFIFEYGKQKIKIDGSRLLKRPLERLESYS
jgi:ribonuclease P protein subunit POP4